VPLREFVNRSWRVTRPDDFDHWLVFMGAKRQMDVLNWIENRPADLIAEGGEESGCLLWTPHRQAKMMKVKGQKIHGV
jgi:hypothetical protein